MRAFPAVLALLAAICLSQTELAAQQSVGHRVVPLKPIPSEQWIEILSGEPTKAGAPYVIRLHNDAGYVVLPHTHPEDEHIVVISGVWSLGSGARFSRPASQTMAVGGYGYVPKKMPHFGVAKTEAIYQIHGIGPFSTDLVDPVYELTDEGVAMRTSFGAPGRVVASVPTGCFTFKLGERARAASGEGVVVGALCSPANRFTQYWVKKASGERFWAEASALTKL
jgi:hypothetical protein